MATYIFKCNTYTCEGPNREVVAPMGSELTPPICTECNRPMVRSYRAENVAVDSAVGNIRRGIATDEKSDRNRDLFLPTGDDFLRKNHGDRKKAQAEAKDWNDRHEPEDPKGNKYRPKVD